MKKKLITLTAVLGLSVLASWAPLASSAPLRYCDTSCPTADGRCNCPLWSDKPKAPSFCAGWNTVGGCWYE